MMEPSGFALVFSDTPSPCASCSTPSEPTTLHRRGGWVCGTNGREASLGDRGVRLGYGEEVALAVASDRWGSCSGGWLLVWSSRAASPFWALYALFFQ